MEIHLDLDELKIYFDGGKFGSDVYLQVVIGHIIKPFLEAFGLEVEYELFLYGKMGLGERPVSRGYKEFLETLPEEKKREPRPDYLYAVEKKADILLVLDGGLEEAKALIWLKKSFA